MVLDSPTPPELAAPSDEQIFYLRLLARYLCSRKNIKTLTLADAAAIMGDQKQKENKTQAFLNRYTRGPLALTDYRAFWRGILKLHLEHARHGVELFDDPVVRTARRRGYPRSKSSLRRTGPLFRLRGCNA